MTLREFDLKVHAIKQTTKGMMGECLAHALEQEDWEFVAYGGSSAVLVDSHASMAVVLAFTQCAEPFYSCAKTVLDGDSFVVVERDLQTLKEVYEFLNE